MPSSPQRGGPGPLERTALELRRIHWEARARHSGPLRHRRLLRESDALLGLVEECRLARYPMIPAKVHSEVVRLARRVDPDLRDQLGINRTPDHVAEVLFGVQEALIEQSTRERGPVLAEIIPLFPDAAPSRQTG